MVMRAGSAFAAAKEQLMAGETAAGLERWGYVLFTDAKAFSIAPSSVAARRYRRSVSTLESAGRSRWRDGGRVHRLVEADRPGVGRHLSG